MLYLVPTPIGNLGDITLRAIEVLKQSDLILAEDTRNSSILLNKYQIKTPMRSFHAFNEHKALAGVMKQLDQGKTISLISDAGTPGISDPGYLLVRECLKAGIKVECLPGGTALIPALVVSGIPTDRFCFEGFLPAKKGRQTRLKELAQEYRTIVLYESPHRLERTLGDLIDHLGPETHCAVVRELSKIHEEVLRGSLEELRDLISQKTVKGEIVIVIQGKK